MSTLTMTQESSTPSTPSSGKWSTYFKSDGLYLEDSSGNAYGPLNWGKPDSVRTKYIITPSVASNNLTLALKYIDGTDCSTVKKITFRVGNTEYSLTAAMSFTKNAGTNWCNAGSNELKTQDIDWFVYAIGETGASAGLKFGFSRIPYAKTMNDFVNTSTNEKYIAGNWTNFNTTDAVHVIGRFQAQLSAGAGYTWSIPSAKVLSYPIYETDSLVWVPTVTSTGGTPTTVTKACKYKIVGNEIQYFPDITVVNKGTATGNVILTPPMNSIINAASGGREIASTGKSLSTAYATATNLIYLSFYDATTIWVDTYQGITFLTGFLS